MQERAPSGARKPTARRSAERSAQSERTRARFPSPGLILTTRKIASFVSGAETGCETATAGADAWALMGLDAIAILLLGALVAPVKSKKSRRYMACANM